MTDIEQFIQTHIKSVDHLRAVLLLHGRRDMLWDADALGIKLHLPPAVAGQVLASLEGSGLLRRADENGSYRYQPKNEKIEEMAEMTVELDRAKPVTLINMIYSRPKDIQAFIDAFRFSKDKEE